MCSNPALSNKKKYPTFARTYSDWTPALVKTLKKFNWKTVVIIYDKSNKYNAIKNHLLQEFRKPDNDITVSCQLDLDEDSMDTPAYRDNEYGSFMRNLTAVKGGSKYKNDAKYKFQLN